MSGLEPFFLISEHNLKTGFAFFVKENFPINEAAVGKVCFPRSSLEWSWIVENDEVSMSTIKAANIRKHKIICGFILMFLDVRNTAE